jgi:4a-hydroxytetrahydrobiopterin dehydratase
MKDGKLSDQDIQTGLSSRPGWRRDGDAIVREFTFGSFPDAIAFTTRLAFEAEAADHHPDLGINYKRVTVRWSTHDAGGVTEKDLAGAKQADTVAERFLSGTKH